MRRTRGSYEGYMRQQREGAIRRVLKSMQVSLAALICGHMRDRETAAGIAFLSGRFLAERLTVFLPTEVPVRTPANRPRRVRVLKYT
jgi:hypothetical protein